MDRSKYIAVKAAGIGVAGLLLVSLLTLVLNLGEWMEPSLWRKVVVSLLYWMPIVAAAKFYTNRSGFGPK